MWCVFQMIYFWIYNWKKKKVFEYLMEIMKFDYSIYYWYYNSYTFYNYIIVEFASWLCGNIRLIMINHSSYYIFSNICTYVFYLSFDMFFIYWNQECKLLKQICSENRLLPKLTSKCRKHIKCNNSIILRSGEFGGQTYIMLHCFCIAIFNGVEWRVAPTCWKMKSSTMTLIAVGMISVLIILFK